MRSIVLILSTVVFLSCKSREEKIQEANAEGKFQVEEKASYAKGVGEALSKDGKEAAEKVSEGVGEVFKGLNKGFDKSLIKIEVRPDSALKSLIKLGRSGKFINDSTNQIDVVIYAITGKDWKGKLLLKAFGDETELGRAKQSFKGEADDAQNITFSFDKLTPLDLADYYTLELGQ